ncbi:acyl-CoA dehydrogenase family protein [Streptomyces sp. NPDC004838]
MTDTEAFRGRVRDFLGTVPRLLDGVEESARARTYRRALHEAGLSGLSVPREYGGQGLDEEHELLFAAETEGRAPVEDGVHLIGLYILPALIEAGAVHLAAEFGSRVLSGELVTCQMFSEPEAGSDLWGVRTRAVRDGEGGWIVTGQKVWTSLAHMSDIGVLLARTDPSVPKQAGLSMFLIDMAAEGVEVRPLKQSNGDSEFNEVFLDEVRVPGDRMIGAEGEGWKVGRIILGHERKTISRMAKATSRRPILVERLLELAESAGRAGDPQTRRDLTEAWMGERIADMISRRSGERALAGHAPGPETSLGKLYRTENAWRNARIASDLAFSRGAAWAAGDTRTAALAKEILGAPSLGFGGGTDEIQRNTIGEQVLGLPREPSVERGVPFNELPSPNRQEKP